MKFATTLLLIALLAPRALTAAVVLQYHHVDRATPAATSTSPERFAMHLDSLERAGFEVVPLERLVAALQVGAPLPDRAVAITFDDGYASIYQNAWPLLKARGWPFTLFVNTEPHDRQSPAFMSWDQLRELRAGGATIANHTVSHPHLRRRPGETDPQLWALRVRREITAAQRRIEAETGDAPRLFAYPYGEFDNTVLEVVEELGYAGFGQQSGPLASHSDLRALPRFPFGGPYGDSADFATKLNSLPMPLAGDGVFRRLLTADGRALDDIVLQGPAAQPVLLLRFAQGFDPSRLNCFVSGQGRVAHRVQGDWVRIQAAAPLAGSRARYNCTAPSDLPGRHYWYSQPWLIE